MDRREFINTSIMATLAGKVLSDVTLARAATPPPAAAAPAQGAAPARGGAATAQPASPPRKLILDAYSRHFQWIRDPDKLAEAAIEITCGGVMPTVQAYPGHIDPTKVKTELPAFVKTMQKHGLRVKQVRGGNQTSVTDANVEDMVGTMGQIGVTHYWCGTDSYDLTKPILPQLDAIKRKVEGFVRLNQKHGTTLMYHTRAGANSVGSAVWDLLSVLKEFDPKYVGFHWDTGHMALHTGGMWELLLRAAGPYIVGVSWKDRSMKAELGLKGEGGPYPGPGGSTQQPAGGARGAAPDEFAPPGAGGGGGARGAAPGGAPGGAPAGAPGGAPGAPGGAAGGGGARAGGARQFPLPLAGTTFARGGGWTSPYVLMGTGMVDVFRTGLALRDIGFNGPMELEAEYDLGGADRGADKLTLPEIRVIGALKHDVLVIRTALRDSGCGLEI